MPRYTPRKKLERLLDERNEHPEALADIDAKIRAAFEREVAIFVLDMCGFSRLTLKHGILHYLSLIRRMHVLVIPILQAHGGTLVKAEADNVFAVFGDVKGAYAAALRVHTALAAANRLLPQDWDLRVGIGIGFGALLLLGHDDVFGAEMNLASKLGEDVACAGDVLLTESAFQALGRARQQFTARRARLGKLSFRYHIRKATKRRTRAARQTPLLRRHQSSSS